MNKRMTKLYEIQFLDEASIQHELEGLFIKERDRVKDTRKALLVSAYSTEDRRRLTNRLFKEHRKVQVQEEDILWAYFPPELTQSKQTMIRSFFVKAVESQKNKIILSVRFAYEKKKSWFDPKLL